MLQKASTIAVKRFCVYVCTVNKIKNKVVKCDQNIFTRQLQQKQLKKRISQCNVNNLLVNETYFDYGRLTSSQFMHVTHLQLAASIPLCTNKAVCNILRIITKATASDRWECNRRHTSSCCFNETHLDCVVKQLQHQTHQSRLTSSICIRILQIPVMNSLKVNCYGNYLKNNKLNQKLKLGLLFFK